MTDRTQFEAMLEALINEDQETAKEIFHNIVVAKSREIYEELLAEDFTESSEEEEEESVEESSEEEEEESVEEGANPFADSEEEEEEEDGEEEGDATDDFADDEEGEEEGEDGAVEDRVQDLEDALEELKAEFDELMSDEEHEPEHHDGQDDPDFGAVGGADEFSAEPEMDELAQFMEYVDKVALPKHGDNGANPKSIVASKNDMGGTTANIAKGGVAKGEGTAGGLLKPTTTLQDAGNMNKPGANVGKTAFKKKETAAKAADADNKRSIVGSRK